MRYPLVLIFSILVAAVFAQDYTVENLVHNPSFEDPVDTAKPFKKSDTIEKCVAWNSPNSSSPKIFTTTTKGVVYDSYGSTWGFKARSGKNVAGLEVHGGNSSNRDYIQGTLRQPLEVGKKYYFSFWVHYHCSGTNNIGIAFIPNKMKEKQEGLLELKPASYQSDVTKYDAGSTWTEVRDSFVAYKPYESFIIGNFFPDENTKLQGSEYGHYFAYIDDILIVEAQGQEMAEEIEAEEKEKWAYNENKAKIAPEEPAVPAEVEAPKPLKPEKEEAPVLTSKTPANLNHLSFDQASTRLTSESFRILDALVKLMQEDASKRVIVKGFASSEGSHEFNRKLSSKRAQIVVDYLVEKGLALDNIMMQAYGEAKPIAPNDTEDKSPA